MATEELEIFNGEVVWFENVLGFGFIKWAKNGVEQKDMFCHFSDLLQDGFKQLKAGQKVTLSIGFNKAGREKAINVTVVE